MFQSASVSFKVKLLHCWHLRGSCALNLYVAANQFPNRCTLRSPTIVHTQLHARLLSLPAVTWRNQRWDTGLKWVLISTRNLSDDCKKDPILIWRPWLSICPRAESTANSFGVEVRDAGTSPEALKTRLLRYDLTGFVSESKASSIGAPCGGMEIVIFTVRV